MSYPNYSWTMANSRIGEAMLQDNAARAEAERLTQALDAHAATCELTRDLGTETNCLVCQAHAFLRQLVGAKDAIPPQPSDWQAFLKSLESGLSVVAMFMGEGRHLHDCNADEDGPCDCGYVEPQDVVEAMLRDVRGRKDAIPAVPEKPLDESERQRILAVEKALRKERLRFIDRLELADELHRIVRPIKVILHEATPDTCDDLCMLPAPERELTAEDEALIDKGWEQLKAADIAAKGSPRDIVRNALDPFAKDGEP
jgi:hypothetical protein